jgi:hypothetical protein|tara:strand:- start:70 stop:1371 length:1302 start_codon:yes stop_codon:yes gene_type:complete
MAFTRPLAKGFGSRVPQDIQNKWIRENATLTKTDGNPFELDDSVLQETIQLSKPIHETRKWTNVIPNDAYEYHGRYLIHDKFVRYDRAEQPREKSNEIEQVNELTNDFEVNGLRKDAEVCVGIGDPQDIDPSKIKGLSGYHRRAARNNLPIKQKLSFYDLYTFKSLFWERVARNVTNHHGNPQLKQKWTDYKSEAINAVNDKIIERDEDSISDFVNLIAADKPAKTRKKIIAHALKEVGVYPNFRTYAPQGSGEHTIQWCVTNELNLPKMGFEGRTDNDAEEIKKQGYILYASDRGDALRAWGSGINKTIRWGTPIWVLGYSNKRVTDLLAWRETFIEEFLAYKQTMIQFAHQTAKVWVNDDCSDDFNSLDVDDMVDGVDESLFPIKLAGFLPQHTSRNAKDGGRPTEVGLVDVYGKTIKFNPKGDCLTLTQP